MKAIELLKDYKNIDFGCNVEELHNDIYEAVQYHTQKTVLVSIL